MICIQEFHTYYLMTVSLTVKTSSQWLLLPSLWPCIVETWLERSRLFWEQNSQALAQKSSWRRPPSMTRSGDGVLSSSPVFSLQPSATYFAIAGVPEDLWPSTPDPTSVLSNLWPFCLCSHGPLCAGFFFSCSILCLPTPNSYLTLMTQFRCYLFSEAFLDFFPGWQIQLYLVFSCVLLITFLPSTRLWVSQGHKTVAYSSLSHHISGSLEKKKKKKEREREVFHSWWIWDSET